MASPGHPMGWIEPIRRELAEIGMELCDLIAVDQVGEATWLVPRSDIPSGGALLLVANTGPGLWSALTQGMDFGRSPDPAEDPVDTFSHNEVAAALDRHLPGVERRALYPFAQAPFGHCPCDLVALGTQLGWHTASPMGLGIHADYGMWTAYRSLWWLDLDLPPSTGGSAPSEGDRSTTESSPTIDPGPCASCRTVDCVDACPPQALRLGSVIDLDACTGHRLSEASSCAQRCLAREACPVGIEHRYLQSQIEYHYSISLASLRRWRTA